MEQYKQEFIEFMVDSQVLKFGEFTLKSGRKSPFFMNAGAYVTGTQLSRLGEYYAKAIHDILINHPERIRKEKNDMKIKKGFVLRNVVDEYIVMPTGDNIAKFEGAVVLNEVSAFVFKQLENSVSRDDLLAALLNEFEVDEATAAADLDALLRQFTDLGLMEA